MTALPDQNPDTTPLDEVRGDLAHGVRQYQQLADNEEHAARQAITSANGALATAHRLRTKAAALSTLLADLDVEHDPVPDPGEPPTPYPLPGQEAPMPPGGDLA